MSLSIKYAKVFGVPISPDSISTGTVSLVTYPAITGDYVTDISVSQKTYTFNLRGINEAKALEIIGVCDANAESLAKGEIDLTNLQASGGVGTFLYRDAFCLPFSYEDGGTLDIGGTTKNYSSFNVTVLTNIVTASL